MAMYYSALESDYVKAQRMEREPGVDLVRCSDGLWRTEEEKSAFDAGEIKSEWCGLRQIVVDVRNSS